MYKKIPTFTAATDKWTHTIFKTKEDFKKFLLPLLKEPGKYAFDKVTLKFKEQAFFFENNNKQYNFAPYGTIDYINYWNTEKEKCREGAIFVGKHTWYLSRNYYMWLNFLPLYDKDVGRFRFPDVRDGQYHLNLYEQLAIVHDENIALIKKRQFAISYYFSGKMINYYFFEEGAVSKIAASFKDYISEKGTWKYLEEYRNFLNQYTAWYRPSQPDKIFNWQQKISVKKGGGNPVDVGLKSVISGHVLDKDPGKGVGGYVTFFFHEEAGMAPKMNVSLGYLMPALKSGMNVTGHFAVAGSVGDLKQCEPLKKLIYNPKSRNVYAVSTNLVDEHGATGDCGLFIPEQWSMPPFIDKYGNSDVKGALAAIEKERIVLKKEMDPEDYQLEISQKPTNLKEAFAYREGSIFPLHLVQAQIRKIEDKEYFTEYVELSRGLGNKIEIEKTKRVPISEFPISKSMLDKRGCVIIYERPKPNPKPGQYFASIDPVRTGKTTSTDSLASIIVYKATHDIDYQLKNGSIEKRIEQGKVVAVWSGRYDDLNGTHEELSKLVELYNAQTLVENNVSQFTIWMISKHRQKYLVPRKNIVFLKELEANKSAYQQYGWLNTGTMFKSGLLPYAVSFLSEEIHFETDEHGNKKDIVLGVDRIPDLMLLKEMMAYRDGLNVDRLIAFSALAAYVKIQEANMGYVKIKESEKLDSPKKNSNLFNRPSPKMAIGNGRKRRSAFKNLR